MLPSNKKNFSAILKKLTKLIHLENIAATDVIKAVLWIWAKKITPTISIVESPFTELINDESIKYFAEWLEKSEILNGAFWLSSMYASLITEDHRRKKAMYFTPPSLSNRMIANAGEILLTGKIIDPACGGAAFLAPAAQVIVKHMESIGASSEEILSHIENNLYGIDSEPFLQELSCAFLRMILSPHIAAAHRDPCFKVICADGLLAFENELHSFDLVLSNPPYRKMTRDEVLPLLNRYSSIISGQPNLYSAFIKRALDLLKAGGKTVLLTPMSFLSGKSFSKLRYELVAHGRVNQLDLIHNRQGVFLWAEQDAIVTVWEKDKPQDTPAQVNSLSLLGQAVLNGEIFLPKSEAPWIVPRSAEDSDLISLFRKDLPTLSVYGYVPRTGAVVVHRDKRKRYTSFPKATKAKKTIPLIWQRDIGIDGELKFNITKRAPDRFIDVEDLDSFSIVKKPAVALQRVTSSDQSRRLICAPITEEFIARFGGVIGENHVCLLEQAVADVLVDPVLLSKILRTKVLDRLFRCISGATNVSAYELGNLPLPDPTLVKLELNRGRTIEQATCIGFGLKPDSYGEQ